MGATYTCPRGHEYVAPTVRLGDEAACPICRSDEIEVRLLPDVPPVQSGQRQAELEKSGGEVPAHDCWDNAVPYVSDGALGHGAECGICGAFLQAG